MRFGASLNCDASGWVKSTKSPLTSLWTNCACAKHNPPFALQNRHCLAPGEKALSGRASRPLSSARVAIFMAFCAPDLACSPKSFNSSTDSAHSDRWLSLG
uniref:Uncharacterized protein P52 n=1 Tax=Bacteriophage APSE-2 TaxID=340054 RepID=Q3LZQ0_9CAUD|nr:conserved hypothetical protein [Bacteriophage APSE-2]